MFYRLLYYFGFLPIFIQVIILALGFVIFSIYLMHNRLSFKVYFPSLLIVSTHIIDRLIRWVGNDNKSEEAIVLSLIAIFIFGYIGKKVLKLSTSFVVSLSVILLACSYQNILLIGLGIPISIIGLLIESIKSIKAKNLNQFIFSLTGLAMAIVKPNLSGSLSYIITFLGVVAISNLLSLDNIKTFFYVTLSLLIALFFNPLIAIECILIIEQVIRCIKAQKPISFIFLILGNFLAFWLLGVIFNINSIALIFVIAIVIFFIYIM